MKKLNLLAITLIFILPIFAQTPEQQIADRMTYVFAQLNLNNVPTGILSNYGVQPIDLEYYNGVPADSNYVNLECYKQLYAGLYSAKVNNTASLISPVDYAQQIDNFTYTGATPVAIMHFAYNRLKDNAVELGLVTVVNDQIKQVNGAASPYETRDLFVATPKETVFKGGIANFIFPAVLC